MSQQAIDDAKLVAHFFQALLVEGVGPDAAVALTSSYLQYTLIMRQAAVSVAAQQSKFEKTP